MTLDETRVLGLLRGTLARPESVIPTPDERAAMLLLLDRLERLDRRVDRQAAALRAWAELLPLLTATLPERVEELRRCTALAFVDAGVMA